jgi:outer membrane protein assembly factor BamB
MSALRIIRRWSTVLAALGCVAVAVAAVRAADQPQWGQRYTRNMVSAETGLPDVVDLKSGKNVKWKAQLGSQTYCTPTVGGGCVLIGTNNENPRDPRQKGDRGILLCLDEKDGSLKWQLVTPKRQGDQFKDWPNIGPCSAPTIDGNRVYTLTNLAEVVCLDLAGMSNGNDGPYKDEAKHMISKTSGPIEPGAKDADIIWLFDLVAEVGIWPHDAANCSVLVHGDYLYINTCNGVDNTHHKIRAPEAPSLIVLDKKTGKLVATDNEAIGTQIIHATWSSPSLGDVNGQTMVIFAGGDGVVRGLKALVPGLAPASPLKLEKVWTFDPDPTHPRYADHRFMDHRRDGPSAIHGMPVLLNQRIYVAGGGDFQWGKHEGWVKCVDATKTGDVTKTAEIWSYAMKHTCCTPAVADGLLFATDCGGVIHCLDAATGKPWWTQQTKGEIWCSALVADGKVYVGSKGGEFWIMAAAKEKKVLCTVNLGTPISSTPVAANGVVYVATAETLFAFSQAASPPKP